MPLELSSFVEDKIQILPGSVERRLRDSISALSPLVDRLSSLPMVILIGLIVQLTLLMILLGIHLCIACGWPTWVADFTHKLGSKTRLGVHIAIGVILCLPYLILVTLHTIVVTTAKQLPAWVEVGIGDILWLNTGAFVCLLIAVVAAAMIELEK